MLAMRVCVPVAQNSFWRSNEILFLSFDQRVYIFEQSPKSIEDVFEDVYCPGKVLSQQREIPTSWRLCKNSEVHFWLCKVWSLVVCSQSSFYLTRARKDIKNWQNTRFLR